MAKAAKKKIPAKKRAYVKKSDKWTRGQTISAIKNNKAAMELTKPGDPINPKKDTEVESLALICSIFDNWNQEQKTRHLKYLFGRYYDFL
jgi:hypothetical protein